LFHPPESPWRVPFDGSFHIERTQRKPPDGYDKLEAEARLRTLKKELFELQRRLYAQDRYSLLLVFQAMDAAGKDSTIRAVMAGVNPAGCQVHSFKQPSDEELDHDFLWRSAIRLPERGRIGIFNRSYYEEVLVVRVHPELLEKQKLPQADLDHIWGERYRSIRDHEQHLAANGTVVLKFFLNVSREKQQKRFLARIDDREKHWKFSSGDIEESAHWDEYMRAYQDALNETSRPWAPWYAIPADKKPSMRAEVCEIIVQTLRSMHLKYPELPPDERAKLPEARARIVAEQEKA
jgi:PPK2 family polyphosphate:nucleotide phosphotransferase